MYNKNYRFDKWVIEEHIATGGICEVYKAHHHNLPTNKAALKVPKKPEYVDLLKIEATTMDALRHPNIAKIIDAGFEEQPYLAIELGTNIEIPVHYLTALSYVSNILNGLAFAHEKGIIHRDLKPGNLILVDRILKITDFNMAKVPWHNKELEKIIGTEELRHSLQTARTSVSNKIFGTLGYMSPEQEDIEKITEKSDIYSVGIILYEMITGMKPRGSYDPSSKITGKDWIDNVINRALDPNPDNRPSAKEFKDLLRLKKGKGRSRSAEIDKKEKSATYEKEKKTSLMKKIFSEDPVLKLGIPTILFLLGNMIGINSYKLYWGDRLTIQSAEDPIERETEPTEQIVREEPEVEYENNSVRRQCDSFIEEIDSRVDGFMCGRSNYICDIGGLLVGGIMAILQHIDSLTLESPQTITQEELDEAKRRYNSLIEFLAKGGNVNGDTTIRNIISQYEGIELLFPDESNANEMQEQNHNYDPLRKIHGPRAVRALERRLGDYHSRNGGRQA